LLHYLYFSPFYFFYTKKICQLYPEATPTALTSIFFQFYSCWDWSKPISLCQSNAPDRPHVSRPWILSADSSRDVMQIMTPLHPSTNTSRNVSHSALRVLRGEFNRAARITQNTAANAASKTQGWRALFNANAREFFSRYPVYVFSFLYIPTQQQQQNQKKKKKKKKKKTQKKKKKKKTELYTSTKSYVKSHFNTFLDTL
jgi:poly(A) polymerase Pap1